MPTIILTRSDDDNARTALQLASRGLVAVSAPMIELRSIEPSDDELETVQAGLRSATVLLTSAHATRRWLELRRTAFAEDAPEAYLLVGASSAALLETNDPTIPILAVVGSASELGAVVPRTVRRIVYPCSRARRDEAVQLLSARGIEVFELPLYEPSLPVDAALRMRRALGEPAMPRIIVFFSPSAVVNWFSLRSDIPSDSIFVAIGPTTAESLRAHGVGTITTSGDINGETLADAIERSLAPGG